MPLVKGSRLLIDSSVDLGFNLKFMLSEKATHEIMPTFQHLGDLYLDYPYSDSAFYDSYIRSQTFYYFLFGLIVTVLLFLGYSIKICCLSPGGRERGSIIPHIFSIKCAALAIYPTYAEYVNYCYGFMTADIPWLNDFFGSKFGDSNDAMPQPFGMYYTNLSMGSTYFIGIIICISLFFLISLFEYLW